MPETLDAPAVMDRLRARLATVQGLARVYSQSASEPDNALPVALSETPCATISQGQVLTYTLTQPRHAITYEVLVHLYEAGGFLGQRAAVVLPLPEAVLGVLLGNVTLGGLVTYVVFKRHSGLTGLTYGGNEYTGYELVLEVQQQAAISAAPGGAT